MCHALHPHPEAFEDGQEMGVWHVLGPVLRFRPELYSTDGWLGGRTKAMVKIVPDIRWDASGVQRVTGTPIDLHALYQADDAIESAPDPHRGPPGHRDDGPEEGDKIKRRMPILSRGLKAHGYSDTCPRCDMLKSGRTLKARSYNHTEACRPRIYRCLRTAGDPRIDARCPAPDRCKAIQE